MTTPEVPKPNLRKIYRMEVQEIRDYNPAIRELFLHTSEPFHFRAGQFAMLHVPVEGAKPALRAYSIASTEHQTDGFRLIFKFVEGGVASQFVWKLKVGDQIDFTGPFGRVFFQEPPTDQVVMLNTGSGISQHFSYLTSFLAKYPQVKFRLLFGVRTENDIYYRDELEVLAKNHPHFQFHYVLSRAGTSWNGKKGYVQNQLEEFKFREIPTTFYMCGNGSMIKDAKTLLTEAGIDPKRIWAEAFD